MHEQQDYSDIKIISMSYLEFVCEVLIPSDNVNNIKLSTVLDMSLGLKDFRYKKVGKKKCLIIMDEIIENTFDEDGKIVPKKKCNETIITPKEFDEIRKIILFQNIPNYDDRYVNPEVKRLYETYTKSKNKGMENPTLEKQKVFVISKTGILMKSINNMTYRTFSQIYTTNVRIDLYFSQKILQASEKYKIDEAFLS